MTIDIFIKSYSKDMPFLAYCLRSIRDRLTGFRNILLVVPEHEVGMFAKMQDYGQKLLTVFEQSKDFREGYLFQQICKLKADEYSDAHLFCYIDSDCIVRLNCDLSYLFRKSRPVLMVRKWEHADTAIKWKEPTQAALGMSCPYECMCRHPAIHYRETLQATRQHISLVHGRPWEEHLLSLPTFSEFNLLGTFAWHVMPERYYWMDQDKDEFPPPILEQFYSHDGITAPIMARIKAIMP